MVTNLILQDLDKKKEANWTVENLKPMSSVYKTAFKDSRIQIIHRNLVLYKPIFAKRLFFYNDHSYDSFKTKYIHPLPCITKWRPHGKINNPL